MRTQSGGGYDSHKEGSWIMKSMTCTQRIWGFERGKRRDRLEVTVGSKAYKTQKHFKHFRPKVQHEKTTSNLGIQWAWQFLRVLPLSLYFYPRERKFF